MADAFHLSSGANDGRTACGAARVDTRSWFDPKFMLRYALISNDDTAWCLACAREARLRAFKLTVLG